MFFSFGQPSKASSKEISPGARELCNLGYLNQSDSRFALDISLPTWPTDFQGVLEAGDRARMELIAVARADQSNPLHIEIAWGGQPPISTT